MTLSRNFLLPIWKAGWKITIEGLLAEAVFADNSGEELFTPDQAVSYLNVLEREEKQAGVTELQARLRDAAAKR